MKIIREWIKQAAYEGTHQALTARYCYQNKTQAKHRTH